MSLNAPRLTAALDNDQQKKLAVRLADSNDVTLFVDGTAHRLSDQARDAVVDLLQRLATGDAVTVASVSELLTTSQAAELAGISHTFMRNMTDRGELPVQYRGTHRRIKRDDVIAWVASQRKKAQKVGGSSGANSLDAESASAASQQS